VFGVFYFLMVEDGSNDEDGQDRKVEVKK
jgi:hypothetical protein